MIRRPPRSTLFPYTDALPICAASWVLAVLALYGVLVWFFSTPFVARDRKSTRLNSSHSQISYAVFCLKKKKPSVPARGPRVHEQVGPHSTSSAVYLPLNWPTA